MAQAQTKAAELKNYYEADNLAERIVMELLELDFIPDMLFGVNIHFAEPIVTFSQAISYNKELFVQLTLQNNTHEILSWQMRDTGND
jgi:hypothetical protein